jgi:hypothetical protein
MHKTRKLSSCVFDIYSVKKQIRYLYKPVTFTVNFQF